MPHVQFGWGPGSLVALLLVLGTGRGQESDQKVETSRSIRLSRV
jgi:hypothetical protein